MRMKSEPTDGKIKNLLDEAKRQTGAETEETSSIVCQSRVFSSADEAAEAFSRLRKKLFQIDYWNDCSTISSFCLFDKNGIEQRKKTAAVGDFIRISLPGSAKDDWVKIIEISDQPGEIVLTIQPSPDPTDEADSGATSHFFTRASTNNFCLEKSGAQLSFYVIGLNEKTNTTETDGVFETIRNYATAHLGCFFGVQKKQWETFAANFLGVKTEN